MVFHGVNRFMSAYRQTGLLVIRSEDWAVCQEFHVLRPSQFVRQHLTNRIVPEQLPHVVEVGAAETLAVNGAQICRELLQQPLAILSGGTAPLLVFHNVAAYVPIGLQQPCVDRLRHPALPRHIALRYPVEKGAVVLWTVLRHGSLGIGVPLLVGLVSEAVHALNSLATKSLILNS